MEMEIFRTAADAARASLLRPKFMYGIDTKEIFVGGKPLGNEDLTDFKNAVTNSGLGKFIRVDATGSKIDSATLSTLKATNALKDAVVLVKTSHTNTMYVPAMSAAVSTNITVDYMVGKVIYTLTLNKSNGNVSSDTATYTLAEAASS